MLLDLGQRSCSTEYIAYAQIWYQCVLTTSCLPP